MLYTQSESLAEVHLTAFGELVVQLPLCRVLGPQQLLHLHVHVCHNRVDTAVVVFQPQLGLQVFRTLVNDTLVSTHEALVGCSAGE